MRLVLVIILLILAMVLYLAKRLISNKSLERLANAVAVVSLLAALAVFIIPAATSPLPTPELQSHPLTLAYFDEYSSSREALVLSRIPELVTEVHASSERSISQPTANTVALIITNEHSPSRVHIRNYIPIQLTAYSPVSETYDVFQRGGGGGGFYIRNFVATLPPQAPSIVRAAYLPEGHQTMDEIRGQPGFEPWQTGLPGPAGPDYFYLDPGESEIFAIELNFLSPGHYSFQLGVEYLLDSQWTTDWLIPSIDTLLLPQFEWYDEGLGLSGKVVHAGKCSLIDSPDGEPFLSYDCVYE